MVCSADKLAWAFQLATASTTDQGTTDRSQASGRGPNWNKMGWEGIGMGAYVVRTNSGNKYYVAPLPLAMDGLTGVSGK